jgi:hypothetical protein
MAAKKPPLRLLPLQDRDAIFLYRWIFRLVLAALLFFIVLGLWGIDLPLGRIFAADAFSIFAYAMTRTSTRSEK